MFAFIKYRLKRRPRHWRVRGVKNVNGIDFWSADDSWEDNYFFVKYVSRVKGLILTDQG